MYRWFAIVVITVAGTVVAYFWFIEPLTPYGIQQRHMAEARRHLPAIRDKIVGLRRFRAINVEVTTAADGGIWIFGKLASESDYEDLKKAVDSTSPPRPARWEVEILPPNLFDEMYP